MTKLRVQSFSISIDGYGAGPIRTSPTRSASAARELLQWFFATRTFQKMHGSDGGATGIDDDFAARGFANIGAWILGRNMFGPIRGPWPDDTWKGWWGETRLTTLPSSSSPTIHAHQSPWTAAPFSILSPMVLTPH